MSELVSCPFCDKEIENDSYFCDQCGEKLKLCPKGHGFKKGKICSQCGCTLVEAHTFIKESPVRDVVKSVTPQYLVGKTLSAKLLLKEGAIIGRRSGDYIDTFCSLGYVSGTHAKLQKNSSGNWVIIDLNSTNGTFVNGKQIAPDNPVVINVGDEIALYDTKFIVE